MPEADVSDVDLDRMSEEEVMDLIKAALNRLTPVRFSEVIEAVETKVSAEEFEQDNMYTQVLKRYIRKRLKYP